MGRTAAQAIAIILCAAVGLSSAADDKDRKRAERRLRELENRARKIAGTAADESEFFLKETQRLIERSRKLSPASHKFERLLEALDDLMDAREDLVTGQRGNDGSERDPPDEDAEKEDRRADTARHLERAYFRVQQAEYFGRLSKDEHASQYIVRLRRFYQQARAAYDGKDYRRAEKLASASSELVNVLENLAQAEVRRPEPPVLK
jgi:hypothetical protein